MAMAMAMADSVGQCQNRRECKLFGLKKNVASSEGRKKDSESQGKRILRRGSSEKNEEKKVVVAKRNIHGN